EGAEVRAGQLLGHVVGPHGPAEVTAHDNGLLTEWLAHHEDPVAPGQPLVRIGGTH
ncbi:ACP S-malonyltransferase, partial [Micromonospora sp. NPDC005313]